MLGMLQIAMRAGVAYLNGQVAIFMHKLATVTLITTERLLSVHTIATNTTSIVL